MMKRKLNMTLQTLWDLWTATEIKLAVFFSFLCVCLDTLVGGFDGQIGALVALVALDILTGFVASFKTHSFMSSIATKGLYKKATMFLIIGLGVLLDNAFNAHMVRTFFISAFAIIEALSIVENTDRLGYGEYIPEFLRRWLAQIAVEKKVVSNDVARKEE